MTVYLPGQRVVLIRTNDPYTALRPGALGTVHHHDPQMNAVAVAWDDGSTLSMLLGEGDRIVVAPGPQAVTADAPDDERPMPADGPAQDSGLAAAPVADSGAVAYVTELPSCDIHRTVSDTVVPAGYDGATRFGSWAFMCDGCFLTYGLGLGIGRGQRLVLDPGTAAAGSGSD